MVLTSKRRLYASVLLIALSLIVIYGLWAYSTGDSSNTKSTDQFVAIPLLPKDSLAYYKFDANSTAYKNFISSAWAAPDRSYFKFLANTPNIAQNQNLKLFQDLVAILRKTALLPNSTTTSNSVSSGLLVLSLAQQKKSQPFALTLRLDGALSLDLRSNLKLAKQEITAYGIKTSPHEIKNAEAFYLVLNANPDKKQMLHFACAKKTCAIGNSFDVVKIFVTNDQKELSPFEFENEKNKNLLVQMANPKLSFSSSFTKIDKILKALSSLIPDSQRAEFSPQDFPFSYLALTQQFDISPSGLAVLGFNTASQGTKAVLEILNPSDAKDLLELTPANSALNLQIDGRLIASLFDLSIKNSAKQDRNQLREQTELIKLANRFSFSLRGPSSGSLWPEILVAIESPNSTKLHDSLKKLLTSTSDSLGLGFSKWQSKSLAGVTVDYKQSVAGFGVYISSDSKRVLIASSEPYIGLANGLASNQNNSLLSKLSSIADAKFSERASLWTLYVDMKRFAGLLRYLQNSGSLFGLKTSISPDQLNRIEQLGLLTNTARLSPELLLVDHKYYVN